MLLVRILLSASPHLGFCSLYQASSASTSKGSPDGCCLLCPSFMEGFLFFIANQEPCPFLLCLLHSPPGKGERSSKAVTAQYQVPWCTHPNHLLTFRCLLQVPVRPKQDGSAANPVSSDAFLPGLPWPRPTLAPGSLSSSDTLPPHLWPAPHHAHPSTLSPFSLYGHLVFP